MGLIKQKNVEILLAGTLRWLNQPKMALLSLPSVPKLFSLNSSFSVFRLIIILGSLTLPKRMILMLLLKGGRTLLIRKPPRVYDHDGVSHLLLLLKNKFNYPFWQLGIACLWHLCWGGEGGSWSWICAALFILIKRMTCNTVLFRKRGERT